MTKFFPGFERRRIAASGVDINLVTGGSGPPRLLAARLPADPSDVAQDWRRAWPPSSRWSSSSCAAMATGKAVEPRRGRLLALAERCRLPDRSRPCHRFAARRWPCDHVPGF